MDWNSRQSGDRFRKVAEFLAICAGKIRCLRYVRVAVSPIKAVTRECAGFVSFDDEKRAVSVVLDFMEPACTRRRLIDCGCESWLDKLKRHGTDLAEAKEIASQSFAFLEAGDTRDGGLGVRLKKRNKCYLSCYQK
jgi:hypothetical protein